VADRAEIVDRVTRWVANRPDVSGLLLVGSVARGTARPDSDVDLVLLTTDVAGYLDDHTWAGELSLGPPIRAKQWGPISERRFHTDSGLEIEFGIGPPSWADIDPVDPGTHRVINDGCRILHDPNGSLARLLHAVTPSENRP
jgi:uncharacterized protein